VHDLGMHGLPATILDKPGPLTATESERMRMRMRMHAYYTERMLARPPALPGSAPSPRWRMSGSTAPATIAACPGRPSRPPGGSSPRPTPFRP
jgi:hypothetical protein